MDLIGAGVLIFFLQMFSSINCDCYLADFQECYELNSQMKTAAQNIDMKAVCETFYKISDCVDKSLDRCARPEDRNKYLDEAKQMFGLAEQECVERGYERGSGNSFRIEPLLIGLLILFGPLLLFQY